MARNSATDQKKTVVYVNIDAFRELVDAFEALPLMSESEIEFLPAISEKLAPH